MGWYEAIKDAIGVAQKADNLGLMRQLLDAQKELLDLNEEVNRLKRQIKEQEEQQKVAHNLVVRKRYYYRLLEEGKEDLSFCTTCWDAAGKLIRIIVDTELEYCGVCATKKWR